MEPATVDILPPQLHDYRSGIITAHAAEVAPPSGLAGIYARGNSLIETMSTVHGLRCTDDVRLWKKCLEELDAVQFPPDLIRKGVHRHGRYLYLHETLARAFVLWLNKLYERRKQHLRTSSRGIATRTDLELPSSDSSSGSGGGDDKENELPPARAELIPLVRDTAEMRAELELRQKLTHFARNAAVYLDSSAADKKLPDLWFDKLRDLLMSYESDVVGKVSHTIKRLVDQYCPAFKDKLDWAELLLPFRKPQPPPAPLPSQQLLTDIDLLFFGDKRF